MRTEATDGRQAADPARGTPRGLVPLVVWVVALAAGTVLFHTLGSGPLAPPPRSPAGWGVWAAEREPLVATVALLRVVALLLSWYLVGATTIGVVARLLRAARVVRVADALTLPVLRRLLQGALGLSLATAVAASALPAAPTGSLRQPDEIAVPSDDSHAGSVSLAPDADVDPPSPDTAEPVATPPADTRTQSGEPPFPLRLLGDDDPIAGETTPELVDVANPTADETPDDAAAEEDGPSRATHEVRAGDSLWSIARQRLVDLHGDDVDDRLVTAYWREVVEHNRAGLTDPDNPDLIFPGEVVELPTFDVDRAQVERRP